MTAKLTASADGSKVLIGTAAEDALEINATAKTIKALSPYNLVAGKAVAQTWEDVTASRVSGTIYTNNTGQPIAVSINANRNAANSGIYGSVSGIQIQAVFLSGAGAEAGSIFMIVPAGATYSVTITGTWTALRWSELR
jgi:hypothetical protein